ncbi:hypothetical protein HOY82DRAFT_547761 [Tuber indicum]|nr:hypothetical protein HOY82DRAFT_547761 [Tuber indicum]
MDFYLQTPFLLTVFPFLVGFQRHHLCVFPFFGPSSACLEVSNPRSHHQSSATPYVAAVVAQDFCIMYYTKREILFSRSNNFPFLKICEMVGTF